jgi:hypothetical protein
VNQEKQMEFLELHPIGAWSADELDRLGRADEVGVASRRPDGTLRGFVTIWAVRVGEAMYIRSAHGHENPWFQRALRAGQGRIRAAGLEHEVAFEASGPDLADVVTAAYHAKYDRYGPRIVGSVVSEDAVRSTLRVMPT